MPVLSDWQTGIKSEKTSPVEERNQFGFPSDARDHHFVKKNPKRLIG